MQGTRSLEPWDRDELAFLNRPFLSARRRLRLQCALNETVRVQVPRGNGTLGVTTHSAKFALQTATGPVEISPGSRGRDGFPVWGFSAAVVAAGLASTWLYRYVGERYSFPLLTGTLQELPAAGDRLLRLVERLIAAEHELSFDEAADAMHCMLETVGEHPARVAAFLVLLRRNGAETGQVLAGMAAALLERAVLVSTGDLATLDIVGTGGDGSNTVNISTAAAIVAAACGARVAKHGNRSASSKCGSADVLEALGVAIDLGPERVARCIAETGISFLMAPRFHPQLATVAPLRRSLRVRTVFNNLGPLLNPARSRYQVIGVAAPELMEPMAEAVARLGTERSWIVHCAGLDEMAPIGATEVIEVRKDVPPCRFRVEPETLGMPLCTVEDLVGDDCAANAATITSILQGAPGPISNAIIMNAGAGLVVYGLAETLQDACDMAANALMSGAAWETLEKWKSLSRQLQ